jgi:hypothetical protein
MTASRAIRPEGGVRMPSRKIAACAPVVFAAATAVMAAAAAITARGIVTAHRIATRLVTGATAAVGARIPAGPVAFTSVVRPIAVAAAVTTVAPAAAVGEIIVAAAIFAAAAPILAAATAEWQDGTIAY